MTITFPEAAGTRWSVLVQDVDSGETLLDEHPDRVLNTASIGKVFLLHRLLADVDAGARTLEERITRQPFEQIDESGIWHLLQQSTLSLYDVAALIGATSDNAATNTLIRAVGLDAVQEHTRTLGYQHSGLDDIIRWPIPPGHPRTLSHGNADELVRFVARLARGEDLSRSSTDTLQRWLGAGCDLSMVAAPFNLDPLAHFAFDRGVWLWNKTGTLRSVRADVGLAMSESRRIAFAVLCQWNSGEDARDEALAAMAEVGRLIGRALR